MMEGMEVRLRVNGTPDGGIEGIVEAPDGLVRPFTGWMALMGVLEALVNAAPSREAR